MTPKHYKGDPIRNGLPLLRLIAPWAHYNTIVFSLFNVVIGISLALSLDGHRVSAPLLIVNEVLTYQIWGAVFIALGVCQYIFLRQNKWAWIQWTHRTGTALKATWAIALIVRVFVSPGTVFLTVMWVALMLIQVITFIFIPTPKVITKEMTNGRTE